MQRFSSRKSSSPSEIIAERAGVAALGGKQLLVLDISDPLLLALQIASDQDLVVLRAPATRQHSSASGERPRLVGEAVDEAGGEG